MLFPKNSMLETVASVECQVCKRLHTLGSDTYLTVYGNICIGESGGVVGNNLNNMNEVERVSVYCRSKDCFPVKTLLTD